MNEQSFYSRTEAQAEADFLNSERDQAGIEYVVSQAVDADGKLIAGWRVELGETA
jgi:hypothetical protein